MQEKAKQPATPPRTILVVEDDTEVAQSMQTLLRHYDYEVRHATNVFDGITQANRAPDVILLDLKLPDGDGERILRHVRRRRLSSKVIVMTGALEKQRLRDIAGLKPDAVQLKPINFFELLEQIRPTKE